MIMETSYQYPNIQSFIQYLVDQSYSLLQTRQTIKKMPYYLHQEIIQIIYEMMGCEEPYKSKNQIKQQNQSEVPKIQKDTLMPKEIDHEKKNIYRQKSPTNMSSIAKTKRSLKLANNQSNNLSKSIRSVSLNNKQSRSKIQSSISKYESLQVQLQPEDPQIIKYRNITQIRLKYEGEYKGLLLERQKSFISKLQEWNTMAENNKGVTHDYDGENINSTIQTQQNIKYYNMRASFAPQAKRKLQKVALETNYKTIDVPKNIREKELNSKEVREMQFPLFPAPKRDLPQTNDIKNYKLNEYKKHFGRKYSRLDEYSKSINLSAINYEQNKDQIFSQRKHLKDSSSFSNENGKVACDSLKFPRRLALPRLNGKYKVLDRYEEA